MKQSLFIVALVLLTIRANAQQDTIWRAVIETQIKTLSEKLVQLNAAVLDSTHAAEKFDEAILNQIYALQGQLQDISYHVYERTNFNAKSSDEDIDPTPETEAETDSRSSGFKADLSPRTIARLGFGFGFSDIADFSNLRPAVFPNIETGKSGYISWQFLMETRLGKRSSDATNHKGFNPRKPWKRNDQFKDSRVSLLYGITIDRNRLKDNGGAVLTTNDRGEGLFINFSGTAKRNEIIINSVNLPVLLQFRAGKDLVLRAGAFAGMRTGARQIITYTESEFDYERIRRANFDLAKYTYGLVAGLGWEGFFLTGKFHLNPWFKNSKLYDLRLAALGLTLTM